MFWRSPNATSALSTTYQFTNAGSYTLPENDHEPPPPPPPPAQDKTYTLRSLIYYAAVAKGTEIILAEYSNIGEEDEEEEEDDDDGKGGGTRLHYQNYPAMAWQCLQNIPPLHTTFSYTTMQRRFICLLDGMFTYCAIMDEALGKAHAFSFLHKIRDAFKSALLKGGRVSGSQNLTLRGHFLDEEIVPLMRQLGSDLVGIPQRERNRLESEQQHRDIEEDIVGVDLDSSSIVCVVAPPLNYQDLESNKSNSGETKAHGSGSPWVMHFFSKLLKAVDQMKEVLMTSRNGQQQQEQEQEQEKQVEVLVDEVSTINKGCRDSQRQREKTRMCWCNVKAVIMLDVLICLFLLAIWLGICHGISCVAR